ncbi:MAG: efflux RND transporter periplasmic adaptor subunit [Myxococcaceae bacterium]
MAALFVLLGVALAFVPWQQTAYGEGGVVAYSPTERQQSVDAPVEGWLEEWFVQEGSHVEQGAPIARIVDNDPQLLVRVRAEQEAAHARLKAAERALDTALRNVRRQWQLFNEGLSSRKQYEEAQLKEAEVMKELAGSRAELARVDTRLARQGRQLVTAPRRGVILRRAAGGGGVYVKPGDWLAILVPETESRAVELWMDGNDLPLVAMRREVRLQFEGWPAIQFSGWPSVAVGTFGATVSVIDAADAGHAGKFRILVSQKDGEAWPQSQILRQGVRAHGWVLLNAVPLGFELWRRFNDFPPSLSEPPKLFTAPKQPNTLGDGTAPKSGADAR